LQTVHRIFPITPFDQHWFAVLNGMTVGRPGLDRAAVVLAKYAPEIWAVIFLLLWFWPPLVQNRARRAVVYAVAAGVLALVINVVLTHLAPFRPRPFVFEPASTHLLVHHVNDSSFPSDHAAGSFGFAMGLFAAGATDGLLALVLAAAVAVARVMVGLHWPTDVLTGAAVGIVAGAAVLMGRRSLEWLVQLLFAWFRIREPRRRLRVR
jgi:undecaprenyl-diphosphatase